VAESLAAELEKGSKALGWAPPTSPSPHGRSLSAELTRDARRVFRALDMGKRGGVLRGRLLSGFSDDLGVPRDEEEARMIRGLQKHRYSRVTFPEWVGILSELREAPGIPEEGEAQVKAFLFIAMQIAKAAKKESTEQSPGQTINSSHMQSTPPTKAIRNEARKSRSRSPPTQRSPHSLTPAQREAIGNIYEAVDREQVGVIPRQDIEEAYSSGRKDGKELFSSLKDTVTKQDWLRFVERKTADGEGHVMEEMVTRMQRRALTSVLDNLGMPEVREILNVVQSEIRDTEDALIELNEEGGEELESLLRKLEQSEKEITQLKLYCVEREEIEAEFNALDTNHDGMIDRPEWNGIGATFEPAQFSLLPVLEQSRSSPKLSDSSIIVSDDITQSVGDATPGSDLYATARVPSSPASVFTLNEDVIPQPKRFSEEKAVLNQVETRPRNHSNGTERHDASSMAEMRRAAQAKWDELDVRGTGSLQGSQLRLLAEWSFKSMRPQDWMGVGNDEIESELRLIRSRCHVEEGESVEEEPFMAYYDQASLAAVAFTRIEAMKRGVKKLDLESLTREDVKDMEDHIEVAIMTSDADEKWRELDANEDGTLDDDEALTLAEWVYSSFRKGGLEEDVEEDGVLAEAARLLKRCDTDEDGVVNKTEFRDYYRRMAEAVLKFRRALSEEKGLTRAEMDAYEPNEWDDTVLCDHIEHAFSMRDAEKKWDELDDMSTGKLSEENDIMELAEWVWSSFRPDEVRLQILALNSILIVALKILILIGRSAPKRTSLRKQRT